MKSKIKITSGVSAAALLLVILFTGLLFQACENTDEPVGVMPEISYIRITEAAKSDSLVTHAFMGSTVAIMGKNLENVDEIWFNDQKAFVNFSFVTPTSIIVTVPNVIPVTVTNMMFLINSNKIDTLKVPFGVDVPAPFVSSLLCEYVGDGETAVIKGNFFIDDPNSPLKVFFPGNLEGIIQSVSINEIQVLVPQGAGVGPIQVRSIYGSTRSTFWFRDDRNIVLDFDVLTAAGGWRSGKIGNANPTGVSGNYVRFQGAMAGAVGASWGEDDFSFDLWPSSNGRPDAPFYNGEIEDAVIKFECFVVEPWSSSALQMIFTPYSVSGTNGYIGDVAVPRGLWIPWKDSGTFKTDGWITVTLPLRDFKYTGTGGTCANALTKEMLRGLTFFVWNGGVEGTDCTPHICIDNIRVVPAK
ncbi:MAG TPA: glycan-binding surface protein [Bacteroidales bacterium]|nr:glycan-binding surface protein [Bacteroidales bacterium]